MELISWLKLTLCCTTEVFIATVSYKANYLILIGDGRQCKALREKVLTGLGPAISHSSLTN